MVRPQSLRLARATLGAAPLAVVLAIGMLVPSSALAIPNGGCLVCHSPLGFEHEGFATSVHSELSCGDCHRGFADDPHGHAEVPEVGPGWLRSAIEAESSGSDPSAWAACGTCHEDVVVEMGRSRHVRPFVDSGSSDGAFCGDCHGAPHTMAPTPANQQDRLAFVSATCESCHTNPELIDRYDLNPDVVFTFEASIHGRAMRLGHEDAPTCVDCHDAHHVVGGDEPTSPVALANRVSVCGQCHEGANENFASVFSHTAITPSSRPLEYWVTFFFVFLTLSVILGMLLHIALDAYANLREALARR
jgi:hypothetical protein